MRKEDERAVDFIRSSDRGKVGAVSVFFVVQGKSGLIKVAACTTAHSLIVLF